MRIKWCTPVLPDLMEGPYLHETCYQKMDSVRAVALRRGSSVARVSSGRIDNDGDYEPGNVEFITKGENTKGRHQHEHLRRNAEFVVGALSLSA